MVALIDIVDDSRDQQPVGHREAKGGQLGTRRQLPFDLHRQAGIARIEPVTVPARARVHDNRQLDVAARHRWSFGDQFGLDCIRSRTELRRCRRRKQHYK